MTTKEEKKRTFESELALPPLKMVLSEPRGQDQPLSRKANAGRANAVADDAVREEVVLRLIERLIAKE
jgi:hypothetical protein